MRRIAAAVFALLVALSTASAQSASLHDGLERAREDRAADPAAVGAFERLAREYGTPLYVYDRASITGQWSRVREAFASRFPKLKIFYAVKANPNPAIISLLHREGAGAEVVS